MNGRYILENHQPVPCPDIQEWGKWMATANRKVRQDHVNGIHISTVFLGLDHGFFGGLPMLFETMIFGGKHDQYQDRCSTWEDAEKMHARAVDMVIGGES